MKESLETLLALTRELGNPDRRYVIIGEGNTSHRIDDDSFWIKASGQQMNGITADGFVPVRLSPILGILDQPDIPDADVKRITKEAVLDPESKLIPSIEASFHALLLADCDVACIAHTHPIAVNQILCSSRAEQFASNRIFPDEVVLCGPRSVLVPYSDPGVPLAQAIRREVRAYMDAEGEPPKVILLANHGLIALGQTAKEALTITAMCVKAAEIFSGACAIGEPVFMSPADINHIYRRPDEIYRRKRFVSE
jgi:rhamnose utilization protein RhaD (predicted bifunctional aldolase and dehydrogenase)